MLYCLVLYVVLRRRELAIELGIKDSPYVPSLSARSSEMRSLHITRATNPEVRHDEMAHSLTIGPVEQPNRP